MANIVDNTLAKIDAVSGGMVAGVYGDLGASLFPAVRNILIISMIFFGISMMLGWIEYPARQFAKNTVKIVMVLVLAFNWSYFNLFFYDLFTNAPDAIGTIILGSIDGGGMTSGSISSQIGELLEKGIVASGAAFASDGWFMPIVLGALIFIAILMICGFALALLILSKIAMIVILSLGPLFVIFLLIEQTKPMFASWLQQIFNFAFITILTYTVMAFFGILIAEILEGIPGDSPQLSHIAPLCIIGFAGSFVLAQIPGIASGLAGGVQVGTMGAFSAMGRQAQRVNASPALKQAGAGARNLYSRVRSTNKIRRQ